ncbi:retrovirus-related pol polyprotein from transposon TNT 1-94 [Tanacetum coccineum]|uniref:Retrovirus-related pol polyprotein from transposon TNT 1-94 n=1 Tax=Tanacetum coccineum TaxID=301880 RepID=A0ABQ5HHY5_9ASTR
MIRCDNGTEFKNREMNQFCEMKGILRQFSVARTPQKNGVADKRNRTLIEAARTMLADSKLPTTFWAEVVNNACYVQNRVLVVKPHNKTPYELFHGRKPTLSFMRPFGCPVTILKNIYHLGKFDGKADEGFFVEYSLNSKAFRVFNSRTRILEENLHIMFSENTPNTIGSGPDWLFDIDALTRIINYEPIVAGTQSNGFAGTKASDNAGQARKETEPVKNYILLPLWTADPPYSQDPKSSHDDGSKPSSDDGKKVDEDPRKDSECNDQEKEDNVNSTNNVNAAGTNEVNVVGGKTSIELPFDPNMPALEDYSIFDFSRDDEDDGAEADMNNLDTTIQVSPIPTTRIHKDHPLDQVIGDLQSATQTRKMLKNLKEHGFVRRTQKGNSCIEGSKLDRGYAGRASIIQVTRSLDFSGFTKWKKATGSKWIDYDEVFSPVARIEAISLFLAYDSFKDFVVYQMDVKGAFLYGKIKEEMYVCQPPGFEDPFLIEYTRFTELKTASTPMETQKPLLKDENGEEVDVHLYRHLKGQPILGLWYPKDSPFDLVAYTDSDYARASLDRKSTIRGKAKKSVRLMMEKLFRMELELMLVTQKDVEGIDCLPNSTIFEELTRMGYEKLSQKLTFYKAFFSPQWKFLIHTILQCLSSKTTAWNEFSSTMASAIIYLSTNKKFNFSKYIFESIVKNLDNLSGKFLMYPRFVQVFLNKQLDGFPCHKRIYDAPSHAKKIFGNMKRVGKGFSGRVTPLFPTMVVQNQSELGEDEAVYKERGDSLVRAATTASRLEEEHDSGGGLRCQETIRDTIAQTRFENVSTQSYDPLLARVLDLEKTKTTQANEIASLKRRVKKLEKKRSSRTYKLKRLYKVGLSTRVESFGDEESLGEDASKQGRMINVIDVDEDITLVNVQDDAHKEMFDVNTLTGDEVFVEQEVAAKDVNLTVDEVTLAQALAALKSVKPKVKGNVIEELSVPVSSVSASTKVNAATTTTATILTPRKGIVITESTTTTTTTISSQPSQDKGKGIMVKEPVKPIEKRVQIMLDEEIVLKLQEKIDEEERIARAEKEKINEANIAWDDIQAKVDADY